MFGTVIPVVAPPSCGDYEDGCSCSDCMNRETWVLARGLLVNANRAAAQAAGRTTQRNIPVGTPFWGLPWGNDPSRTNPEDPADEKLPPMNCKVCMHRNEYVGKEHLIDGVYVCRSCKPRYRGKK